MFASPYLSLLALTDELVALSAPLCELALALGLLCAAVMVLRAMERATSRVVAHQLGWRGVLLTGIVGVPLHELSHLLAATLFGHRIIAWRLFEPDPVSGTLGYVRHAVRREDSAWQRLGYLVSGLAPLAMGLGALVALGAWALPSGAGARLLAATGELNLAEASRGAAWGDLVGQLWALAQLLLGELWAGRSLWFPLQIYLAVAVVCHMAPSAADLKLARGGLLVLLVLMFIATVTAALIGAPSPGRWILGLAPALGLFVLGAGVLQGAYVLVLRALARRRGGAVMLTAENR